MHQKPNILVICGRNKKRSRTAESIFRNDSRFYIRSAGLSPQSERKVSEKDVNWADLIFVMESNQRSKLSSQFLHLELPQVEILHIPDDYEYMDEELIELLTEGINGVLQVVYGCVMKQVYIFSGLGADERVFQKLDLSGYSVIHVKWIEPLKNETLQQYAQRLLAQIQTPKPILIGLSFGGIVAVEVAKQIETEKVILISSAKTKREIPFYFRIVGRLRLHRLLPTSFLKSANYINNWFFGVSSSFDKYLLKQILIDTDPIFLKWAIDKVVVWKNRTHPQNLFQIHGTSDRILPLCFVECNVTILKGGHFMILNRAEELNEILKKLFRNI